MKRLFRKLSFEESHDSPLQADLGYEDAELSLAMVVDRYRSLGRTFEPSVIKRESKRCRKQSDKQKSKANAFDSRSKVTAAYHANPSINAESIEEEVLVCPPAPKLKAIDLPQPRTVCAEPGEFTNLLLYLLRRQNPKALYS